MRAGILLVVVAGCGRIGFATLGDDDGAPSPADSASGADGSTLLDARGGADGAVVPDAKARADGAAGPDAQGDAVADAAPLGPWNPPTLVALPGTPTEVFDDATMSGDRLILIANYLTTDIGIATRASVTDPWGPLVVDATLSSGLDTEPELSSDGLSLYFGSSRTGTIGGYDIFYSARASRTAPWSTPVQVPELSTTADEASGVTTTDGLLIVFTGPGSPRDLNMSTRTATDQPWSTPVVIPNVESTYDESGPFISGDGLDLYFASRRSGAGDLYHAHRDSRADDFGTPEPLTDINSAVEEADPWLAPDGRYLVFTSWLGSDDPRLWEATR